MLTDALRLLKGPSPGCSESWRKIIQTNMNRNFWATHPRSRILILTPTVRFKKNVTEKPNWTTISNGQPALNPAFLVVGKSSRAVVETVWSLPYHTVTSLSKSITNPGKNSQKEQNRLQPDGSRKTEPVQSDAVDKWTKIKQNSTAEIGY